MLNVFFFIRSFPCLKSSVIFSSAMEVPLVLLCTVIVLSFPIIRSDSNSLQETQDMAIDESSPNNVVVHNTFHLSPMDNLRTPEMIEEEEYQDSPIANDRSNLQPDYMTKMDKKIDSLEKSNCNMLNVIKTLESKIDYMLQSCHLIDERSVPKHTCDYMETLEIMTKLNAIDQNIQSLNSNNNRMQSNGLECNHMQAIRKCVSSIERENNNVNQVLDNSWKTVDLLEKLSKIIKEIDYRTVRVFDQSYRQPDIPYDSRNNRCRTPRNNDLNEKTYRNVRIDTSRVFFEPSKYNCHDLQKRRNGIYKFASDDEVSNEAGRFFYERYCDFNTNGGAWTVIQRRYVNDQQENFNRSWSDYKLGFGDLDREFWFGNDFIHKLTFDEDMELRICIEDSTGRTGCAQYSVFKVDSEDYNYNLIVDGYRGDIPDGFLYHNDQEFSTYDRQNDNNDNDHVPCASTYGNGWWFNNCTAIVDHNYKGINFEDWLEGNYMKSSKMMVRPRGLWGEDGSDEKEYIYTSTGVDP